MIDKRGAKSRLLPLVAHELHHAFEVSNDPEGATRRMSSGFSTG